jgi:DNA helicase INO80
MVASQGAGKFGNTWTQATTVVYYSNDYNLESRDQSEDRAHRIGQVGAIHSENFLPTQQVLMDKSEPSVLYVDLIARGTVDERIIKVLKAKKKLTDEIVASNWKWLLALDSQ